MKKCMVLTALLLVMCGGQAATRSLSPQVLMVKLSPDEAKQLCDWLAGLYGGYGKAVACDGGSEGDGPTDQASCVSGYMQAEAKYPTCPVTVGQFQACQQWRMQNMCVAYPPPSSPPDGCAIISSSLCSTG